MIILPLAQLLNKWIDLEKISGLSRLVVANLGVGSTSAQSPPCRTGPATSPFSLESISSVVVGATRSCHTTLESI